MSAVTYRLLTVEDAEAFRALRLHGLQESPDSFLEDYEECKDQPLEYFKRYFTNGWLVGAFIGGNLAGVAGIYIFKGKKLQHKGMLWGVYVAPPHRGKGIASVVINKVVDAAKNGGLELVQLSVNEANPAAMKLYESLGFTPYGREEHMMKVGDHYVTDVMMMKFL